MYKALSYKWANTLFGCVAVLLAPIPFVRLNPFVLPIIYIKCAVGPFLLWASHSEAKQVLPCCHGPVKLLRRHHLCCTTRYNAFGSFLKHECRTSTFALRLSTWRSVEPLCHHVIVTRIQYVNYISSKVSISRLISACPLHQCFFGVEIA